MPLERVSQGFKDVSMTFQRHPLTSDILALKNESAIARSVRNIVFTVPGEKFFDAADCPNCPKNRVQFPFFSFFRIYCGSRGRPSCDLYISSVFSSSILRSFDVFQKYSSSRPIPRRSKPFST